MRFSFWTEKLRQRMAGLSRRRRVPHANHQAERCEDRCLPTVSALLITNAFNPLLQNLTILSDSNDDITVSVLNGFVEITTGNGGGPQTSLASQPTNLDPASLAQIDIFGSDAVNRITLTGVTRSVGFSFFFELYAFGGDGNDRIDGTGSDINNGLNLDGGNGADVLLGGTVFNILNGGDGNDILVGGRGGSILNGGNGSDTLSGGGQYNGNDGADSITGGLFADSINGGNGADTIDGGLGDDTLNGDGGNDTITGNTGNDSILGGANNDSLLGGDGDDTINAQAGNDTVLGEAGNDSVLGGDGTDSVLGGGDNDTLSGDAGNDTISGDDGNDSLFGGAGRDSLDGGFGNDRVFGQSGDDTVLGGGDADLADGGTGNDLVQNSSVVAPAGPVALLISDVTVTEADSGSPQTMTFTVTLSGTSTVPVTVAFTTVSGLALAGSDYVAQSGVLTFNPGVTSQTISIAIVGDSIPEPTENFLVDLSSPTNATLLDAQGQGLILDNDGAPSGITMSIADITVTEGDTGSANAAVTVTLSGAPFYNTSDGIVDSARTVILTDSLNGVPPVPANLTYSFPDALGDFDNDGIPDLVVAARGQNGVNNSGNVYVHLMNRDGTVRSTTVFTINAANFGSDVAAIGDVDGDGVTDLAVGANVEDGGNGAVYIVLMNSNGTMRSNVKIGTNLNGGPPLIDDDIFGHAVARLGDVDSDGVPDLAVGAWGDDLQGGNRGVVYVLLLNANGTAKRFVRITSGENGFPTAPLDGFGTEVAGIGDLNQDGVPDLIAYSQEDSFRGAAYVVFLKPDGTVLNTTRLASNVNGGPALQNGDEFGTALTLLDDLDGDGVGELLIGARSDDAGGTDHGAVYVAFMNTDGTIKKTTKIADGVNGGPSLNNVDRFGLTATSIGDLDGDGLSELAVGCLGSDVGGTDQGSVFVLFLNPTGLQTPISVQFNSVNETATAGTDYNANSGTLTFGNGVTSQTITIPVNGDTRIEGNEKFVINLFNPIGVALTNTQSQITILDDDGGSDTLLGGEGRDTLLGSDGNEHFNGGSGNDSIDAGAGTDTVLGGSGADTINGGDDNDSLNGQGGNDLIEGGAGDDQFVWSGAADGKDTVSSSSGFDTVTVNGTGSANTFAVGQDALGQLTVTEGTGSLVIASNIVNVIVNGNGGDDTITVGSLNKVTGLVLTINGGDGNDSISAAGVSIGAVRLGLSGNAGNDTITGSSSNDTLDGGDGDDSLTAGAGNDSVVGGAGDDILSGQDGADTLNGQDGDDNAIGDNGNDMLLGGLGNDTLQGQAGDDNVQGQDGDDNLTGLTGNDSLDGGTGFDTLDSGDGNDTLDGGFGDDSLSAGSGNDKLRGGDGNDSLDASDGDDELNAGDGDDQLIGGNGNDGLSGGDGDDLVNGGAGNDVITGNDGNDSLLGGSGADTLLGGDGDDSLNGQGGADILAGNEGVDTLSADASDSVNDLFALSQSLLDKLDGV